MKKLIAFIRSMWYYKKAEKALDKGFLYLRQGDIAKVSHFERLSDEYEKKADEYYDKCVEG